MSPRTGLDIDGELARRRTLQLTGPLDDEEASLTAAQLMTLDASGDEPIELRISGSGGSLQAAAVLLDTVDLVGVPVRSTVLGVVTGPLAVVAALSPERRAAPSSRLVFRLGQAIGEGSPDELVALAHEAESMLHRMASRLADRSRLTNEEAVEVFRRGRAFDAGEALAAGIVDSVGLDGFRRQEGRP